jgi:hypothetical protein
MRASRINPNVWNGEERSGGYLAKNNRPTSANSPEFKGRIYLIGVGWYWLSAWTKHTGTGELLAVRAQEMTDEQATKFCQPKARRGKPHLNDSHIESPDRATIGAESGQDDIQF